MTFLEQIQANNDPNSPDRVKARELLVQNGKEQARQCHRGSHSHWTGRRREGHQEDSRLERRNLDGIPRPLALKHLIIKQPINPPQGGFYL